jgi:Family of unknown function (DUF6232)
MVAAHADDLVECIQTHQTFHRHDRHHPHHLLQATVMTIFSENGVSVTETAVSIPGQPLRINDIRGVRIVADKRGIVVPVGISIVGLILLVIGFIRASGAFWVPGIMLAVVGWLAWWTQDTKHRMYVQTASKGEIEAMNSSDPEFLGRVAAAIAAARAAAPVIQV